HELFELLGDQVGEVDALLAGPAPGLAQELDDSDHPIAHGHGEGDGRAEILADGDRAARTPRIVAEREYVQHRAALPGAPRQAATLREQDRPARLLEARNLD